VVAAIATTSQGLIAVAAAANTKRGLYTSRDAGQTWTYDALVDPGGATRRCLRHFGRLQRQRRIILRCDSLSRRLLLARWVTWTRLNSQPGGTVLGTTACPPQSISNNYACPISRGELTVVPTRNDSTAYRI